MNYRDAQELAVEFGAMTFAGDHNSPAFACWADRIAYLPVAKNVEDAVAEANRYCGRVFFASAGAKRKNFDIVGRGL
jgi:hypothetical protein